MERDPVYPAQKRDYEEGSEGDTMWKEGPHGKNQGSRHMHEPS